MGEQQNGHIYQGNIPGFTLKMIAIVTMLIDHIAAVLGPMFIQEDTVTAWNDIFANMRLIGRLAFPIFCFFLVEGFYHTRSRRRYLLRLGLFSILSEVPFDLAFSGKVLEFTYQNVFFTLTLGMLALCVLEQLRQRKDAVSMLLQILTILVFASAAYVMKTDYNMYGVLAIVTLYYFYNMPSIGMIAAVTILIFCGWSQVMAYPDVALVSYYSGQKGRSMKWFFYLFYPVHLLILYGIYCCIRI